LKKSIKKKRSDFGEHMKEENMHVHNPPSFPVGMGIMQQIEEADENKESYEGLPNSIEEFIELIEEIYKVANNEKSNNARTKRSPNRS